MAVRERTFEQVALADPERRWELHQGRLRQKPSRTFGHNDGMYLLGLQIGQQLDLDEYRVRVNAGHVHHPDQTYYIPDVFVLPVAAAARFWDRANVLEVYDAPLPFVAEFWSPSTGGYDVNAKLSTYRRRGDAEIWRVYPFEHRVTRWLRRPDGDYEETVLEGGAVRLAALPGVSIDLDRLFAPPLSPTSA